MPNMQSNDKILFNYKSKEYSYLSNFYVSEMTIDEKSYYHVEGFYQSVKYSKVDKKTAERIRNIHPPHLAKKRGMSEEFMMSTEHKEEWDSISKIITMKRALIAKFITNAELSQKLLATRDAKLIHNDPTDEYWGNGSNNKGLNMLGHMLMEVRDILVDLPDIEDYN